MSAPHSPDDLSPRQRQVVLSLWGGLTSAQTAVLLGMALATLRQRIGEIAERLPGSLPPIQKILLWKADILARQLPPPQNIGLPKSTG